MPGRRCNKITWSLAPIIAILAMVLSSGSQSDLQYDSIVTYPTGDYLSWSTGNDIPWTIDFEDGYNDKSSLKSSPIECAGASRLMMDIPGPAIIRFKWKTDSPSGIGQLLFKVDSNKTFECQSRDWTEFSYPLSAGATHELEWCYRRIKSYPQWSGAGWIDDVNVIKTGQYTNTKYNTGLTGSISQRNESESNWEEFWNNTDNMSERHPETTTQVLNKTSETPLIPNITVVIENIAFTPKSIACAPSEDITVNPLSPIDGETFLNNSLIKFEYIPNGSGIINNCTLFIDGEMENYKRKIKVNEANDISSKRRFTEEGPYEWNVKCCDCGSNCNSTSELIFKIAEKNRTTYVNQTDPDDARFVFKRITDAIARTDEGGQVIVYPGDYEEKLTIEKPLSIIGKNRPLLKKGIIIKSDYVNVSGMNITNDHGRAVCSKNNNYINISYNNIYECSTGIYLNNNYKCDIYHNNLSKIKNGVPIGVFLANCRTCNISTNNISSKDATGIYIEDTGVGGHIVEYNIFGRLEHNICIKPNGNNNYELTAINNTNSEPLITDTDLNTGGSNECI